MSGKWQLWSNVNFGQMVNYGQKYMFGKWLIMDKCKCRANGSYGQMQMSGKQELWTK